MTGEGSTRPIALSGAAVWDGPTRALDRRGVIVRGTRIEAIDVGVPRDALVISLDEYLLVPGFVDAHVHIGFASPREVLRGGVTAVRDLGWPPTEIFELAARSREPDFDGPLIVAAGPMLTVPGGYPGKAAWAPAGTAAEVADEESAARAVDRAAKLGAAIIKVALNAEVGPTLSAGLLDVIASTAAAHGLRVTAHVYGLGELEKAIASGVGELAHMLMSDETIPDALLHEMVARDVAVVPTLGIHRGRAAARPIANLRCFIEAGGTVLYGTDLGNAGPRPGIDPGEIAAMVRAGMDAPAVMAAATATPARRLGLGSAGLGPGAPADIIAVPMAALTDPVALAHPAFVMRAGRIVRTPG